MTPGEKIEFLLSIKGDAEHMEKYELTEDDIDSLIIEITRAEGFTLVPKCENNTFKPYGD